ncbi:hypothetical protein A1359_11770 [Methylomonas lenta]|uniref:Uncharacterized protein n=1 Tax=Methylomonas lenta TaxID=980561 RepID=A0A177N6Z0_9GAMM|nr:hypothetical protein A1359_11770 [Methylomonas lenta]
MRVVDQPLEAKSDSIVIAVVIGSSTRMTRVLGECRIILTIPLQIKDEMELHVWVDLARVIHLFQP